MVEMQSQRPIATASYDDTNRLEPECTNPPRGGREKMLAGPGDSSTEWKLVIDLKDSIALAPGRVRSYLKY